MVKANEFSGDFRKDLRVAAQALSQQRATEHAKQEHMRTAAQQQLERAVILQPSREEQLKVERRARAMTRLHDVSQDAARILLENHASYDLVMNPGHMLRKKKLWATQVEISTQFATHGSHSGYPYDEDGITTLYSVTGIDRRGDFYGMPIASMYTRDGVQFVSAGDLPATVRPPAPEPLSAIEVVGVEGELYEKAYGSIVQMVATAIQS